MANNRMYIRCKICGDVLLIGKHFGDWWKCAKLYDGITLEQKLNSFFLKHYLCDESRENHKNDIEYIDTPMCDKFDENSNNNFEICYEVEYD